MGQVVLIVDDEDAIQRVIGFWLVDAGFSVLYAESAEAALGVLASSEIDVLISDLRLPGMSGVELLQQARKLRVAPEHVYLMSGYQAPDCLTHRLFQKPFDLTELIQAVIHAKDQ